jgi:hypothetical protein
VVYVWRHQRPAYRTIQHVQGPRQSFWIAFSKQQNGSCLRCIAKRRIGTTYPVGTVSIQNAVSRYQVGIAMGAMNFFRGLTAAFIVAIMGAILLATLGVAPERGGHVMTATAANALGVDLAHVFRGVFAFGVLCLIASLVALIRMEERPLRGRN